MDRIKKFLFVNTNNKQTVIKNTFWLFVAEIVVRILKLVLFVYAARKLGTSEWGLFSYALALMSTFQIFSDVGLNSVISREAARNSNNMKEYISTSFFLKLGLSIVSSIALIGVVFFIKDHAALKSLIPITALILFFDSISGFGIVLSRGIEKMETEALIKISSSVLLVIAGFFLVSKSPTAISISYSYLLAGIAGTTIMYYSLKSHFYKIRQNYNRKILPRIFKEALPIAVVGIIGTIMSNIDMLILGLYSNASHVGLYSAAQKPIQIIYLIPSLITTAIFPLFSRLAINEKEKVKILINKSIKISLLLAIGINIAIFAIGGFVFKLMFGPLYLESIPLFKIMALAIITGAPSLVIGNAIFALGKQKELIQFIAFSLILNILLCLILIPKIGATGAAISVTLAQTIGNIFLMIKTKKILQEV